MTIERQRTSTRTPATGRVLRQVSHGGDAIPAAETGPDSGAPSARAGLTAAESGAAVDAAAAVAAVSDTAFNYMFTTLAEEFPAHHLPNTDPAATVAALKRLGSAMVEDPAVPADPFQSIDNSIIPPVYTYWGQFIDHDLTLNTDGSSDVLGQVTNPNLTPFPPAQVAHDLRNSRDPALNLDSVYGDGPTLDPAHPTAAADQYDGIKLKVGTVALVNNDGSTPTGTHVGPPGDDRDLPRQNKEALIGDARNDENLIVAQFHTAFLRFHNAAVDWVVANEPQRNTDAKIFRRARALTRWHYQWLVVNDYLKTVTLPGTTDKVLLRGNQFFDPMATSGEIFMPLEFSIAAFRFGHSMVRGEYDFNQNFGRPGLAAPTATFRLIFIFTGKGVPPFFGATDVLPFNWVIDWERFVHKGALFPDHHARKIDTRLTPPLRNLVKEGNNETDPVMKAILKSLAVRNLLRGYLLSVPTGQAVATALGVTPLSSNELTQGANPVLADALTEGGFDTATPLWYYILKEAEVQAGGDSLGEVGSRIVNETIIGQLRADSTSYLNRNPDWDPTMGITLPNGDPIVTIGDFLTVAGVM